MNMDSQRLTLLVLLDLSARKFYGAQNGSLTEEKDKTGEKVFTNKKKKRVLIQPGERRRNLLTNKSNEQSEKYSPLWKCSKLFIPPQTNGMIHFYFNIGCSESKVIFSSEEKQKPHKSKRAFREANVCISFSLISLSVTNKHSQTHSRPQSHAA